MREMYFSTNDIVVWNFERLVAKEINEMGFESQQEAIEQNLREYIAYKSKELYRPLTEQELLEDNIPQLVEKLSNLVPIKKMTIIDSFTKYMIKVISKFLDIEIIWKMEEIDEPSFITLENSTIKFSTPQNHIALKVFNSIWDYFKNDLTEKRQR